MISKLKEYGPTTLAWFGGLQFLQPMLPSNSLIYLCSQALILVFSIIVAVVYKINHKYKFISSTNKLKLEIYYDNIFKSKYDSFVRVIATDSFLTVDEKRISSKSVYSYFLRTINTDNLKKIREDNNQIVKFHNNNLEYYLVKITDFDLNDKMVLSDVRDYFSILYKLCEYIENNAKGRKILCPVLGGRISFKNSTPTSSDRLNLMKLAFETYDFKREIDITILVKKDNTRPKKYDLHSF
ncbi:macro domain-containing protein [Streptococcus anginosus]|uniref:macro domain-containing protein n=1 Tax=Streptococcus anginosus TaxID=1328 RepID=UPI0018989FF9|nr:macro domain-containing protein [Streptococcus anginosus]MDB8657663.1 DUF6430 domain-containing protein [Streptococcus anginosus]MDX5016000.1 DUF6430 domain-containing protein [Streptococcus anginosus]MDX5020040.1 DUF6430 domain-containing protein [Streptococcus anginosus]